VADQEIEPVLQVQDGSFVGQYFDDSSLLYNMVAFDQSGTVRWIVSNEQPLMATDDGGVIGQSGTKYDQNGNATGQIANGGTQTPGWFGAGLGTTYILGQSEVSDVKSTPLRVGGTFTAWAGGNASGQGTAIQQVMTKLPQSGAKQLPDASHPPCFPVPSLAPPDVQPTCGYINAIELTTIATPDAIFRNFIQNFAPAIETNGVPRNSVMTFVGPGGSNTINVTAPGQTLTITLNGWQGQFQDPFSVATERVDTVNHTISAVTLAGHPLAGWRYWRVYSIATNEVVIETGAYDQPAVGAKNYVGYYILRRMMTAGWQEYLNYVRNALFNPAEGILDHLGQIPLRSYPWPNGSLLEGYWDYNGDFTNYILNNVCQSTSCN